MLGTFFSKNRWTGAAETVPSVKDQEQFKYCPSCGDEFRVEFTSCSTCDKPLIDAAARDGGTRVMPDGQEAVLSPAELTAADNLISIRQGPLMEMKRVQRLLESQGVASLIAGDGPDCTGGCCASSSFVLQVKEEDRARTGSILAEDFRRLTALDSHQPSVRSDVVIDERVAETRCPACGFPFAAQEQCCPECGLCF